MAWKISDPGFDYIVRAVGEAQQITSSNTITVTANSPSTPDVDDIAIGARWHENSVGSTDVITSPAGWTSDAQYLNGSVNLPTDGSHFTVTASGSLSATWTDIDPAITDTEAAVVVFEPIARVISNYAPSADIQVAGWTPTPDGHIFDTLNEDTTPSDADYVTSPLLRSVAEKCILDLDNDMVAGDYIVNIRAKSTSSTGNLRVRFLDVSGTDVGATSIQGITTTLTTYSLSVTLTGTATQVQIEVTT
jgi:hypothetical protein